MQEFSISIIDQIRKGLRKDFRSGRDQPGAITLFNHKPTEFGLRQLEAPAIPTALQTAMTAASITVSHPFPQLFYGESQTFLLTATKLYSVNRTTWALTQIDTFDPLTDATASITTGSSWQFADLKGSYLFFNSTCMIFFLDEVFIRVSDAFTDTNSVLMTAHTPNVDHVGNGWLYNIATTGYDIQSNKCRATGENFRDFIYIDLGDTDAVLSIKSTQASGTNLYNGIVLRALIDVTPNDSDYLAVTIQRLSGVSAFEIISVIDNAEDAVLVTSTAPGTFNNSTAYTIVVTVVGNVITATVSGSDITTTTITATSSLGATSSLFGLVNLSGIQDFDNFRGSGKTQVYVTTTPLMNAVGVFQGRIIFGGFNDGVWSAGWQALLNLDSDHLIKDNSVMWTGIAGNEFWWLINSGEVTTLENDVLQMFQKNQFGWKQFDHQGTMLKGMRLGEEFILYGDEGITRMTPTVNPVLSAPTFAFKRISKLGIMSRNAAVDASTLDFSRHVYLDSAGTLWELREGQPPIALGYEEFLETMIGNDVVMAFNGLRGEEDVYISDGSKCFVLSPVGLCEISKLFTSIAFVDGVPVGIFEDTSDNTFSMVSDALNFGSASIKTVTSVEIIGTDTATMTAALDYTNNKGGTFSRTAIVNSNNEGVIYVKASGYDHRLVLSSTLFTSIEIDDIIIKVQYDDKRNIRGLIAGGEGV